MLVDFADKHQVMKWSEYWQRGRERNYTYTCLYPWFCRCSRDAPLSRDRVTWRRLRQVSSLDRCVSGAQSHPRRWLRARTKVTT